MLHLVPQWQSAERHRKLKVMMQDRPDLIKSELAGLAFDSLQQVFRKIDIDAMFCAPPLAFAKDQEIFVVIDPAAGGPSSDYAVVSLCRQRGIVTVRLACVCVLPTRCGTRPCTAPQSRARPATSRRRPSPARGAGPRRTARASRGSGRGPSASP